jgi:hypothetical protein
MGGTNVSAGAGATLDASGTVGQATVPLSVDISGGLLLVGARGVDGPISVNLRGIQASNVRTISDLPGDTLIDGRSEELRKAQETGVGQQVSAVSATVPGQEVFEAVESQILEVIGDPSEQIEEELRLEEEDVPTKLKLEEDDVPTLSPVQNPIDPGGGSPSAK